MTQKNLTTKPVNNKLLTKRILLGAAIGLIVISLFVFPTEPKPEGSKLWIIRPLIIVPLAGAVGGAFSYFITQNAAQSGWKKIAAVAISLFVFLIGLWMGIVLGLDGTLWN